EHRHGTSPFFYIPVIFGGFFPWSLFLPFGAWQMYKESQRVKESESQGVRGHRLFLFLWFLVVFLFFSVARTKLVTYVFPLFPVLAIVTGRFWEIFISEGQRCSTIKRYMNVAYWIFIIFGILGLIGIYFFVVHRYPRAADGMVTAGGVLIIGIVLSWVFFIKEKRTLAFYSIIVAVMLLILPVDKDVLPVVEETESSKAISIKFKELSKPGEPVGGESDHRRGIAYYADRTDIVDVHPYPDLLDFVSRKERVWCIIQRKHYDQLKGHRPDLVQEPLFQSGKKVLFTNRVKE
ncbi:MAG: hypothetical protein ACE5JK_04480, partial [Candidatus Omnitrophota bacterium]